MSAARHAYGGAGAPLASEGPSAVGTILPLLALVIGLAAATIWFVALPALEQEPAKRSCEVYVLQSGATKCVPEPVIGSQAAAHKPKHSGRATH